MKHLALIITFIPLLSFSQIEVRDTIIMNGSNDSIRTISNLATPIDSTSATNTYTAVTGKPYFGIASIISDTINLTFNHPSIEVKTGNKINFFSPKKLNSSTYIKHSNGINSQLLIRGSLNFNEIPLDSGVFISAIFDGNQFIVLNKIGRKCPNGFIDVDNNFCIEINEGPIVDFWTAVDSCGNKDAKICNWGQWYIACKKLGTSLNDMTNNWEWIDSPHNYMSANQLKTWIKISGNSGCQEQNRMPPEENNLIRVRCCFIK